jgi:two-component system response regulator AlgR
MRILVVDDEALARERLIALIQEIGEPYQVVGAAANGAEALRLFAQSPVDLVLMDVRMPGLNGLETAKLLAETELPPAVIFTTAYEEHALQAFESQAVGYLLKPVRRQKLQEALERAQRLTRAQLEPIQEKQEESVPQLSVSHRGGIKKVPVNQICYLRAESKYVTVRCEEGELLIEESLKSLESRFGDWFMRIHRNALVLRQMVSALEKGPDGSMVVRLAGCDERLEVSRRHLPAVRKWLKHAH